MFNIYSGLNKEDNPICSVVVYSFTSLHCRHRKHAKGHMEAKRDRDTAHFMHTVKNKQ